MNHRLIVLLGLLPFTPIPAWAAWQAISPLDFTGLSENQLWGILAAIIATGLLQALSNGFLTSRLMNRLDKSADGNEARQGEAMALSREMGKVISDNAEVKAQLRDAVNELARVIESCKFRGQ